MKQKQKKQIEPRAAAISPDGTLFDLLTGVNAGLMTEMSREVGLSRNETVAASEPQLPQWGLNIIKRLCKTILKPVIKLRLGHGFDWRNYGRMVGIQKRMRTFYLVDVPRILEEELGVITNEEWERIEPRLGSEKLRGRLVEYLNRPVAEDEPLESLIDEVFNLQMQGCDQFFASAYSLVAGQDAKTSSQFYNGVGEGYTMLMDEHAKFCGERGRTEIYLILISCMMDVEKLRQTIPPTTRPQFYSDLGSIYKKLPRNQPDWFEDVCDDIKLPLNPVGRPRKPQIATIM